MKVIGKSKMKISIPYTNKQKLQVLRSIQDPKFKIETVKHTTGSYNRDPKFSLIHRKRKSSTFTHKKASEHTQPITSHPHLSFLLQNIKQPSKAFNLYMICPH